jgi:Multisubunit Na+/H+ antiporter, MnhG subunit
MSWIIAMLLVFLLAAGAFFILVGSIGLVKFSEFFKRLHAPTKASTLGVGCVLLPRSATTGWARPTRSRASS